MAKTPLGTGPKPNAVPQKKDNKGAKDAYVINEHIRAREVRLENKVGIDFVFLEVG